MASGADFASEGRLLAPLVSGIDLGLHLTLTGQRSLPRLALAACLGRLDAGAVAIALRDQLDAFLAAFGRPPDFIDGHQHVHLLPVVRGQVVRRQ
jgi:predicted glycoside hydrolase/deacetylase ChbG (UPF0249 family)